MRTFNIYKHPSLGFEAVKIGFSWPAFFFGFIWMLVKKLWGLAGLWIAANIICLLIEGVADSAKNDGAKILVLLLLFAAYMALWLVPAFKGNKWRESNLTKRGYVLMNTAQAETPDAAIAQLAKSAGQMV